MIHKIFIRIICEMIFYQFKYFLSIILSPIQFILCNDYSFITFLLEVTIGIFSLQNSRFYI